MDELLESLTHQSEKDFEVVIVEDGSQTPCEDCLLYTSGSSITLYTWLRVSNLQSSLQYMKEGDVVEVVTDTTDGTILLAEMPVTFSLAIGTCSKVSWFMKMQPVASS